MIKPIRFHFSVASNDGWAFCWFIFL